MRFIILICLFSVLYIANADRLLIPIASKHNTKTDGRGVEFNEVNLGLGYEHFLIDKEAYRVRADLLVLTDSYKHTMFNATIGIDYKITDWLSIGTDVGISYKRSMYKHNASGVVSFDYKFIPIALVPVITASYNRASISIVHVPQVTNDYRVEDNGDIHGSIVDGVTLMMIGYSF